MLTSELNMQKQVEFVTRSCGLNEKSAVWVEAHGYKENSQSLTFAMCLLKENVNNILRVCGLVSSMHE